MAIPAPQIGWKLIETAPKDGTEFQAWTECGYWAPRAAWKKPDRGNGKEAFCTWDQVDYDGIEGWSNHVTLTHWMLQPIAPRTDK